MMRRRWGKLGASLSFLVLLSAAIVASYGLFSCIFRVTGKPPEIAAFIIVGVAAMVLLVLAAGTVMHIVGRSRREGHRNAHNVLMDALSRIAQGDFSVLIEPDDSDVHNDLISAINDMAKNLGTLETMRQDFISNVSHEIQSPLTSIGGFAKLLKDEALPPGQRQRYAGIIEAESKRLSSLSDNLLKLSTLENNKMPLTKTGYRLDKQLETVALTLEPQWAAKHISLEADLCRCAVHGDADLLSQAWINLLHNAIKFTPEGGKISVSLAEENGAAVVKIADTGIGIAPDEQMHIFERFYKVDKARDRALGGNGLGLSLVKKIVELHGGSISVESEPGKGTVLEISLPGLRAV
ncbi:MAG: HAMP domain-containing histidine kinase [Oscillospiraceae bacterium]|jgi:signal transduction histidine kinase|nr:HAMP domain-containing histidine kinase [Oscillospiraceae bacterium]